MYNQQFIKKKFPNLPDFINLDLLFNIAYNPFSREMKLYVLNEQKDKLFKIDQQLKIMTQYKGTLIKEEQLRFLEESYGCCFNYQEILIDTYEDDYLYFIIDRASWSEYQRFILAICNKVKITIKDFLMMVNRINQIKISSLTEAYLQKSLSMIRVPLQNNKVKLYSRPFLSGSYYFLPETEFFFKKCFQKVADYEQFKPFFWVASDLFSDRIMISSQIEGLV